VGPFRGVRRARAFAPGHVTGFFVPALDATDPRARGSTGAGLVLDRGVRAAARFDPSGRTVLRVRSRPRVPLPISRDVARRLRADQPGSLEVDLVHDLPVGQGLGMSAAGAVATGLAVAAVLGRPTRAAWETAHLAELYLRGGLGGVAALAGGGLEHRWRAGVPPFGRVRHRPCVAPIALYVAGPPIPSPSILSAPDRLRRIRQVGGRCEAEFVRHPTAAVFFGQAERFTDAVGLAPSGVLRAIEALRAAGYLAMQAMFGQVVLATPGPGVRRSGWPNLPGVKRLPGVRIGTTGAGLLPP